MRKALLTGGAGFAGLHTTAELLRRGWHVTVIDSLTYASRLDALMELNQSALRFVCHDLAEPLPSELLTSVGKVDCIIHNAAESHVVRAFDSPGRVVQTNVIGTLNVLEAARKMCPERFIYVSTDEVFGPSRDVPCEAGAELRPTNPYAAAKAGGEFLVRAYVKSFGVPALMTRTCNMFGPYQHPEKFIPLVVNRIIRGELVPIHTTIYGTIGKRQWCHVSEQARALAYLAEAGVTGEVYHVSAGVTKTNMELANEIADILHEVPNLVLIPSGRPVYDDGYSIEESRFAHFWKSEKTFEQHLLETVRWYENRVPREFQRPVLN